MKFKALKSGLLDLDAFYAPKTQLDAKGRRILWGWIQERRSDAEMLKAGWSGMMSLPRVMNLEKDGSLRLTMLPELTTLRGMAVKAIPKACGEFLWESDQDSELVLRMAGRELLRASYSAATRRLTVDGHEIAVAPGQQARLHGYVDGSVIDLILNESVGYTKRFYYDQSVAPDVAVDVLHGGAARVWGITPISGNRLTTPARG